MTDETAQIVGHTTQDLSQKKPDSSPDENMSPPSSTTDVITPIVVDPDPVPNPGGRPKIELDDKDWKFLETVCQYYIPLEEAADLIGCSDTTLKRRIKERYPGLSFEQYRRKCMAKTKHNLRAAQIRTALNGNAALQIWLGKNMLGQSDNPDNNKVDDRPIQITIKRRGQIEPPKEGE